MNMHYTMLGYFISRIQSAHLIVNGLLQPINNDLACKFMMKFRIVITYFLHQRS
jgi:hypothetical protein